MFTVTALEPGVTGLLLNWQLAPVGRPLHDRVIAVPNPLEFGVSVRTEAAGWPAVTVALVGLSDKPKSCNWRSHMLRPCVAVRKILEPA